MELRVEMSITELDNDNMLYIWKKDDNYYWVVGGNAGVFSGNEGIDDLIRQAEDDAERCFYEDIKSSAEEAIQRFDQDARIEVITGFGADGSNLDTDVLEEVLTCCL